ncbi:MAG: hypothetical protein QOF21_965 [Actinomycetota bacterium]|jgi:uncharacterized protein (UPF0371 family)
MPNVSSAARQRLLLAAAAAEYKSTRQARRKCFLSYHANDVSEVADFIETFDEVFIPKVIGVNDSDPFVDSENTDYVLDKIREKYLTGSTVTIVLVGKCTWARKYVDWEVYSSLRNDKSNRRNGLIAIELPSRGTGSLPPRVDDNVIRDKNGVDLGYARYYVYPSSDSTLRGWIEDAFTARTSRPNQIVNARARKVNNSPCA